MAIVSAQRAVYQRPQVTIGNRKPARIASNSELAQINKAVLTLHAAKSCTNEAEFLVKISDAMKIARDLFRGRNDV